jgi:2-hydroxychromene-2-carboxylate isomerase
MQDPLARVNFYFDFLSIYGYFASLRIEALAARHGREVCWHSMLLGVSVMKKMGLKPLLDTPLKGDYVIHDTARYVRRYSLELNRKVTDPMMDPRAAARGFYWIRRNRPGHEADFARAVFASYWRDGIDLSAADQVARLGETFGVDAQELFDGVESDQARSDLRDAVATSLEKGVFGSPFFIVGEEKFWGSDRLELIDEWLASGGW